MFDHSTFLDRRISIEDQIMGKKGDLLRAAKAAKSTYTFTAEQLEEHDNFIRKQFYNKKLEELNRKVDEANAELKKRKETYEIEVHDYMEKDFAQREKLLTGKATDVTANVFSMLISISVLVLVRDFGWKPIYKYTNGRNKLVRFVNAVNYEVEKLISDETIDIRQYTDLVYEYTGVKFVPEDDDGSAK